MFETQDYYEYDKNNEDNIAVLLQQLTNESNELLADSENDLVRFEHVKNAYRTSTEISPSQSSVITSVISSPPVLSIPENPGSVFITGPNHRGTIYNNLAPTPAPRPQQSVIVRNVQVNKIVVMGKRIWSMILAYYFRQWNQSKWKVNIQEPTPMRITP